MNDNKRMEYIESLSAQMVEWEVQIDRLTDKSLSETPKMKYECAKAIAALQLKRDEAAVKLQGIASAKDDEWEELLSGAEQAMGELRNMLRDTIMKID